jgi:hypothetical protein
MHHSLIIPIAFVGLAGCVSVQREPPAASTTTYVTPAPPTTAYVAPPSPPPPTTTYVTPAYPRSPSTTTVIRTP